MKLNLEQIRTITYGAVDIVEEDEANRLLVQAGLGDELNVSVNAPFEKDIGDYFDEEGNEIVDEANSLLIKTEPNVVSDSNTSKENKEVKKVVQKKTQTKAGKGRGRKAKNK